VGSEHAEAVRHKIRAVVRRPVEVGPAHILIGASVGVLTATTTSLSPARDSLLAADDLHSGAASLNALADYLPWHFVHRKKPASPASVACSPCRTHT